MCDSSSLFGNRLWGCGCLSHLLFSFRGKSLTIFSYCGLVLSPSLILFVLQRGGEGCFLGRQRKQLRFGVSLVAQSSTTGVTVAVTPPCSAICFRNPKVPRYHPPACRDPPLAPCLLRMRQESATGGPEKGATP